MALHFVCEKILHSSDISPQQNRLLIPIPEVRCHLLPLLSHGERRDANLLNLMTKKRKKYDKKSSNADDDGDSKRKKTEIGRKHGGLEVRIVTNRPESREIGMTLTRWDGTLGAVLKGGAQWKDFVAKEDLRKGDKVYLFVFRRNVPEVRRCKKNTELCFILYRKTTFRGGDDTALEGRKITNIDRSKQIDLSLSLGLPAYSEVDLSLSLGLPAYSALRNDPNSISTSSVVRIGLKLEEKVCEENDLNLELTLRQPGPVS